MLNIEWIPNRKGLLPLHIQIYEFIREKIASGEWPVGSKIPSQRVLSEAFGVNRSTIVAALDELKAEGLVHGNAGGGTTVVNNTWTLLSSTPPPDWNSYVSAGIQQPNQVFIQQINRSEFERGIIRLGTGEPAPELCPHRMMQKIFRQMSDTVKSLGYEEPKGSFSLRKEISLYLKRTGTEASPSSILIVSGALQALQLISLGLLHRGSTVFLEKPSYLYSLRVFQSAGMHLFSFPLDKDGVEVKELAYHKQQKNGALFYTIPSFHNPTGVVMSLERRKELMEICERERLAIIEDDVYRELWIDEPPPPPLKTMDNSGLVLYLGSMSKQLSPGLRIGWVVGPEPVIARLADIKMQTDYGSSSLSQWATAELFSSGLYYEHTVNMRKQLGIRRDAAIEALDKYFSDIAEWPLPKGGFYIWLKLNESISMHELFSRALQKGILLNPGSIYESHSNCHLRISYSYASLRDIEYGLKTLSEIVKELLKS